MRPWRSCGSCKRGRRSLSLEAMDRSLLIVSSFQMSTVLNTGLDQEDMDQKVMDQEAMDQERLDKRISLEHLDRVLVVMAKEQLVKASNQEQHNRV